MSICVIEENPIQRQWLKKELEFRYNTITYKTLENLDNESFSVLIISPNLNEPNSNQRIISAAMAKNIKVIIISTSKPFTYLEDYDKAISWLEKPFTIRQILKLIG
jgi:DNA-binding NtrC family response regulator